MNISMIATLISNSCLGGLTLCSLLMVSGMAFAEQPVVLPEDPATPVIELWYIDHGKVDTPEVTVYASGRVQVRLGEGTLWGEIGRDQLGVLVNSLLQQDQLSRLKTEEIEQAIATESLRTGLSAQINNAGDTIIRVRTASQMYRVDGHAVGLLNARFPNVIELQHLYSAQRRLENIKAVVMVGGVPAAERLARLAQVQVQAESGEQIALTLQNLSCVHSMTDGTRYCQFLVPVPGGEVGHRIISLVESPGEIPRVSVLPNGNSFQ